MHTTNQRASPTMYTASHDSTVRVGDISPTTRTASHDNAARDTSPTTRTASLDNIVWCISSVVRSASYYNTAQDTRGRRQTRVGGAVGSAAVLLRGWAKGQSDAKCGSVKF